jgi:hypothetical protein
LCAPASINPAPNTLPKYGFSEDSGTLATNEPLNGVSYELVTEVGRQAGIDKSVPHVTANSEMNKLPEDPRVPDAIRTNAEQLVGNVSQPYAKLLAIQKYMQSFPYNLESRPLLG